MVEETIEMTFWKDENLESLQITPQKKGVIYNHNLLVQLLYLDNCPLFLALNTVNKDLNFQDLCQLLRDSEYLRSGEDLEGVVSLALDTLLDFGIFKAEWLSSDNWIERRFINRNELFDRFIGYESELMGKLAETNFSTTVRNLRSDIYFGEARDLPFKECYFLNRINEAESDFMEFVDNLLLLPQKYDVIIPLARKAWAIFEHLKKEHKIEVEKIPVEYGIYPEKLRNKRVCVFDDAVNEGKQLHKALTGLLEGGVRVDNITLIAYVVNRDKYFDPKNVYRNEIQMSLNKDITYCKALNDLEFDRKVSDILMYIASFGSIIDPDHLIVDIKLHKSISGKNVMKTLKNLKIGKILEPGVNLSHLHLAKKKITIDKIDYNEITSEALPETVSKIDQCKIRTIWEYKRETFSTERLTLTPIINLKFDKRAIRRGCKHIPSLKFCNEIPSVSLKDGNLCVDCTLYHMIPKFLEKFLYILTDTMPTKLRIEDIKWVELESKYANTPVENNWQNFKQRLLSTYHSDF